MGALLTQRLVCVAAQLLRHLARRELVHTAAQHGGQVVRGPGPGRVLGPGVVFRARVAAGVGQPLGFRLRCCCYHRGCRGVQRAARSALPGAATPAAGACGPSPDAKSGPRAPTRGPACPVPHSHAERACAKGPHHRRKRREQAQVGRNRQQRRAAPLRMVGRWPEGPHVRGAWERGRMRGWPEAGHAGARPMTGASMRGRAPPGAGTLR